MSSSYDDLFSRVVPRRGTNTYKWDFKSVNKSGRQLLPMWVADMDFPIAPAIQEALRERLSHPFFGYSFPPEPYFESFRSWQSRRNGWEVRREWQSYSPGVMESVRAAILQFTEPGDEVVVQPPVYYPFFTSVSDNNRTLVENPLREVDGRYTMDLDQLVSVLTPNTKLLVLCSPHNPVGRVWSKSELERLAEIVVANDMLVIADEIHADIVREGVEFVPFTTVSDAVAARTIALHAPSKTFNIPGLSSSQVIIPDALLKKRFDAAIERLGMILPNIMSITASIAAYQDAEPWVNALLSFLDDQFAWFASELASRLPELRFARPEGTYLAWIDFCVL
ncbi:MAG: MalY/PatB family protein, partial [Spirochaetota bacterium]